MADLKSKKVLVVDDQKSMRGLVRFALLQMGMETVDGAESGEEAIKKLTQVRYDLIITDLHMGGISGLGLLKAIRSHPVLRSTPVIMATSETIFGHRAPGEDRRRGRVHPEARGAQRSPGAREERAQGGVRGASPPFPEPRSGVRDPDLECPA